MLPVSPSTLQVRDGGGRLREGAVQTVSSQIVKKLGKDLGKVWYRDWGSFRSLSGFTVYPLGILPLSLLYSSEVQGVCPEGQGSG